MTTKIRSLLSLVAALAIAAAMLAPVATANFEFEPGSVLAKAHGPLSPPRPGVWFFYMGRVGLGEMSEEMQELADSPEATQAGGHPDFTTSFRVPNGTDYLNGDGDTRKVVVDAPAGSIGNPRAVPRCSAADFFLTAFGACPPESQVGEAISEAEEFDFLSPVSSLVPYPGVPALLGFKSAVVTAILTPTIRSDDDYGLRLTSDVPIPLARFSGATVTLWGVPHDPIHDPRRVNNVGLLGGHVAGVPKPFLSAPTNCQTGPLALTLKADSWQHPADWIEEPLPASEPTGCAEVPFEPTLSARPSTNVADSPSGLEVDLHVPQHEGCQLNPALLGKLNEFLAKEAEIEQKQQEAQQKKEEIEQGGGFQAEEELFYLEEERHQLEDELRALATEPFYDCELATSHLKEATVTLPEGLVVNPSGANGLDGCSSAEAGLTTPVGQTPIHFDGKPANCPDASKIGTVEVDTPLLDNPMQGSVFLADPYDNPFKSFMAIYIAVNDPQTGIVATLAGEVKADPVTGQLTTHFPENPQLPFEHFLIHFKQGPHAPLRTPATCGEYMTNGELTPYSAPASPVATTDQWSISQGPGGGCAAASGALPNSPAFDSGVVSPIAGAFSPFVMHLRRGDGSQNFAAVTVSPPPGLIAKLAGVAQCSDADLAAAAAKTGAEEKASPSCPAGSQVGSVVAGAGAGPSPYYAPGKVYMAGPYKGAPLSLAVVTPATAGPFDLGTIVVRVAVQVDSKTAQITAVSDPLPTILKGIPLDIQSVDLVLDRGQFTRTGTSCDPTSVGGLLTSTLGQVASLSSRFQLADCSSLGFKPRLALHLKGGITRSKNPALTAVLTPRPGDANIASLSVAMPHSEFLDQAHIRTVCTRVQFAADQCPPASVYGTATVITPLLDYPLTGNVYLRSSDNTLPDLVPDLRGPAWQPLKLEAAGRTDSIHGGIRNTFDFIPDAPITKVVLRLQGGKKGLLENSRNICAKTFRATVRYTAHNGKLFEARPALKNPACPKHTHRHRGKHSS